MTTKAAEAQHGKRDDQFRRVAQYGWRSAGASLGSIDAQIRAFADGIAGCGAAVGG